MNIQEAKMEIVNTLRAYHQRDDRGNYTFPQVRQRPILLMGPPGIGKTAVMEQIAEECGVGLVSYSITHHTRQSAIGLPKIVTREYGGQEFAVTEYTMSEIIAAVYDCMARTGKQEGILFIDEINCASETLAPAMLQLLQNKTFGSHRIPEGWMLVAAGNPPEYNKSVREFDIVTLDRVRRIDVQEDLAVWMAYAGERRVHGAVLSFLNLKRDRFYIVENSAARKRFVTARGWEDLSELLKSYEELQIPVGEELVFQYIQEEETARQFASYYQLYQKYGTDYAVAEILSGELAAGTQEYAHRVQMAAEASFDERFTVIGLLLDGIGGSLAEYERADRRAVALHSALLKLRTYLLPQSDLASMKEWLAERRERLALKRRMELITAGEANVGEEVQRILEQYFDRLCAAHITEKEEGFARLRSYFQEEVQARHERVGSAQRSIANAFGFAAECFGEEQEMILLVSGLAGNRRAMEFVSLHGSDEFLHYSQILLAEDREELLREAEETGFPHPGRQ